MKSDLGNGVWLVGTAEGSPSLNGLLERGATRVANAADCLSRLSGRSGAAQLEIVVLRTAAARTVAELSVLKEDPWFIDVPVLVVLAEYDDALIAACIRAGALQCLVDPVSADLCEASLMAAQSARLAARQLAFEPEQVEKLTLSFRTPAEAESASHFLSSFCPQPARQSLGIAELLLNAVEHGSLEIGGEAKAQLLRSGTLHEEVARRARDPRFSARTVRASLRRFPDHIEILCEDEGPGFDWRKLGERSFDDTQTPRGRGIALARKLAFDSVDYFGRGNRVAASVHFDRALEGAPASAHAVHHDLSESERAHIETEAQRILQLEPEEQLFHAQTGLAARLLGGARAFLGLVNSEGQLLVSMTDARGEREAELFDSKEELPALWAQALSASGGSVVNEAREIQSFGSVKRSVLAPIRHRLKTIGFLHVADGGGDWSPRDAARLEVLALHLAPVLSVRLRADWAEQRRARAVGEHARALEDQEAARYLVGCLLREGCMTEPGIRHYATAVDVFNGDIALAGRLPSGGLRWMLGDFVGHGLCAAIGGIPLASVFYATTKKGIPLAEVVATMNETLRAVLPPGYFCAAILFELEHGRLRWWNGGMPPALVLASASRQVTELHSGGLPLGVAGYDLLTLDTETMKVAENDRILCYSDGLIETRDAAGELFGVERAAESFAAEGAERAFDSLTGALRDFRGGISAADDLSIVEVTVGVADRLPGV